MGRIFADQQIIMVTGKGGVGKSTVAAAIAAAEAQRGQKVLLVELAEPSYFAQVFQRPFGYQPQPALPHLDVAILDGESCLREFLHYYVKIKKVVDLFFENRVMKALVHAAPALKELAVLGKITSGRRGVGPDLPYDIIVVDAFATGHFEALLKVPTGMAEVIRFGPMGEQSRAIDQVLKDPQHCHIVVVTLPEELPVTETLQLTARLKEKGLIAQIINNHYFEIPFSEETLSRLASTLSPANSAWRDFLTYLQILQQKQALASQRLAAAPGRVSQWPLVTDGKAKDRILALAATQERAWNL